MPPKLKIKLLIILIVILKTIKAGYVCNKNNCKGLYKLVDGEDNSYKIGLTKTTVILKYMQPFIDIIYAKRDHLSIYCYDGSSVDPNTGCYENILNETPDCNILRRWNKESICPTGWECHPDGNCWGSDASKCLDSTEREKVGPKEIKFKGERYLRFPYHTCISSWSCNLYKIRAPVHAEIHNSTEKYYITTNDHDIVYLSNNSFVKGDNTKFDYKVCTLSKVPKPTTMKANATCYSNSINNIVCSIDDCDSVLQGIMIQFEEGLETIFRNYAIYIDGPLYSVKNGKIMNIGKEEKRRENRWEYIASVITRSASIEDIVELSTSLAGIQLQTLYNVNVLRERILQLEKYVRVLISHYSKMDGSVLSDIIQSNSDFTVNWVSPYTFEICPCSYPNISDFSNCNGEVIYSNGVYSSILGRTNECYNYDNRKLNKINLFKDISLEELPIHFLDPTSSDSDSELWDNINDLRKKSIEDDYQKHSYENLEDKLNGFISSISSKYTKWFWNCTAAVAWIGFIGLLFGCFRK